MPFLKRGTIDPEISRTRPTLATVVSRFFFFSSNTRGFTRLTSSGAFSIFFSRDTFTGSATTGSCTGSLTTSSPPKYFKSADNPPSNPLATQPILQTSLRYISITITAFSLEKSLPPSVISISLAPD